MRFDEILNRLQMGFAFCDSIGLGSAARNGRFGTYARRVQELVDLQPRHLEGALSASDSNRLDRYGDAYRIALCEGIEIGDIFEYLNSHHPVGFESRLRQVLSGPLLPSDEDAESSHARNIQFELLMAQSLAAVGFQPRIAEPDLRVEVLGRQFHIACKRVLSPAKILTRLKEAAAQLRRSLRDEPATARGIIGISLSRILNPSAIAGRAQHFREAAAELERWLTETADALRPNVQRLFDRGHAVLVEFHASADFYTAGRLERGDCTVGRPDLQPFAPYRLSLREFVRRFDERSAQTREAMGALVPKD